MKHLLYLILLTFFSFHANAELKYEKVGSWDLQLDGTTFGMTSNSSYSTYFPGGEITLKNGAGKINICVDITFHTPICICVYIYVYIPSLFPSSITPCLYRTATTRSSSGEHLLEDQPAGYGNTAAHMSNSNSSERYQTMEKNPQMVESIFRHTHTHTHIHIVYK